MTMYCTLSLISIILCYYWHNLYFTIVKLLKYECTLELNHLILKWINYSKLNHLHYHCQTKVVYHDRHVSITLIDYTTTNCPTYKHKKWNLCVFLNLPLVMLYAATHFYCYHGSNMDNCWPTWTEASQDLHEAQDGYPQTYFDEHTNRIVVKCRSKGYICSKDRLKAYVDDHLQAYPEGYCVGYYEYHRAEGPCFVAGLWSHTCNSAWTR